MAESFFPTGDERRKTRRRLALLPKLALGLALAAALGSCGSSQVNPATGQSERLSMSPADEQRIGDTEHPKILAAMGGVYDDPEVTGYVAEIGARLAVNSELPGARWTFTVLDSPVVNAFALPGGYVYITRGLLALANDEAEVAGVLGHEIGHVTARHSAQRLDRARTASIAGVLATVGAAVAGIDPSAVGQVAQVAGAGYVASFSREQELEADRLGVRYMSRVGYDPFAAPDFLESLQAQSSLHARLAGSRQDPNRVDFFSTHPATADRARAAAQAAAAEGAPVGAPRRRDPFLAVIDGMTYGDATKEGYVKGRAFLHPGLRIAWEAPAGYRLTNSTKAVRADGPNGEQILFDAAQRNGSAGEYLTRVWAPGLQQGGNVGALSNVATFTANGLPGATAVAPVRTRSGVGEIRLIALDAGDTIYRFLALYPPQSSAAMETPLREVTYSFRKLSAAQAAAIRPYRLDVVTVRAGDSVASLARRMPYDDLPEERFRVLNGLAPGEGVTPGQRVKIVVE